MNLKQHDRKKALHSNARHRVSRVMVDSVLYDDLKSLEVCHLAKRKRVFTDEPTDWVDSGYEAILVSSSDYLKVLAIPSSYEEELPWEELKEGSIFLIGDFRDLSGKAGKRKFRTQRGNFRVQRIDNLIRKDMERLYYRALKGGK